MVVLRFPHLMLADVGDDDRPSVGRTPEVLHHMRRVEMAVVCEVLDVAYGRITLERVDARDPLFMATRFDARHERAEYVAEIADDANVDRDNLADLGAVDIDMKLLGLARCR